MLVVIGGCARPAGQLVAPAPASTPVASSPIPIDAATPDASPPPEDVALPAAWPAMPAWRRAHLDATWGGELTGALPNRAAFDAVSDIVAALPDDDPDIVEATCLAGDDTSYVRSQDNFERGLRLLRARSPSPDQAYGALADHVLAIDLSWDFSAKGKAHGHAHAVTGDILQYGRACEPPDIVNLELLDAESYSRIGKRPAHLPPQRLRRPHRASKLSSSLLHLLALREEIETALGPDHPYTAAMTELLAKACADAGQRARDPAACPTLDAALERGIEIRVKALGEDHPSTRETLLLLGAVRLSANKLGDAEALLRRASAGPLLDTSRIDAALLLAGIEYARGETAAALELARNAAEASATARLRDNFSVVQPWELLADLATAAGDPELAARATAAAHEPGPDLRFERGLAQRADEVGNSKLAIASLDRAVERARDDVDRGPPERRAEARARLRDALVWRAAYHRWHGEDAAGDVHAIVELDRSP